MERSYEFDDVTVLSALAMGLPGKRTFFLAAGRKEEWVRVWLEKHDLQALALAVHQLVLTVSPGGPPSPPDPDPTPPLENRTSGLPSAELEAEEIVLSYDKGVALLEVTAHPFGPQRQDRATLRLRTGLGQLGQFAERALGVCAAGRPVCPLCGGPIDPSGHVCPRNN